MANRIFPLEIDDSDRDKINELKAVFCVRTSKDAIINAINDCIDRYVINHPFDTGQRTIRPRTIQTEPNTLTNQKQIYARDINTTETSNKTPATENV